MSVHDKKFKCARLHSHRDKLLPALCVPVQAIAAKHETYHGPKARYIERLTVIKIF